MASGSSDAASLHGQPVDPPFAVSGAPLRTTDGAPFSLTTSTTKPLTLVFFGYTNCPDICPLVMSNLASAMTRLSDSDRTRVQVLFVTTDPSRDTGPVLSRWLHHLDPDFVGLTGDIATIAAVGALAAQLSVDVVAEGVEHCAELPALQGLGCSFAQGYGLSRPLPASAVATELAVQGPEGWVLGLPTTWTAARVS